GGPPSIGILNRPGPLASSPPVTIHLPSGDHAALPCTSTSSARDCCSAPSPDIMLRWVFPCFLRTTAARRPSGETAGGSRSAPSEPFQISRAWPSSKRHSPSPPPRDDR